MMDKWWLRALVVTAICVMGSSPAQAQFGGLSKIKKAVERAHQQTDSAMSTLDTAVSTATDMANDVSGNRDTTKAAAAKAKADGASTGKGGKGAAGATGTSGTTGSTKGRTTATGTKSTSASTAATSSGQTSTTATTTTGGTTASGSTTAAVTRGTTTTTTTTANASAPALTDANVKKVIAGIKAQQASLKANPSEQITAAAAGVKASGFSEAGYRYMTARILMYCSEGPSVLPKTFKPDELQALDGNRSAIVPLCTDQTITVR